MSNKNSFIAQGSILAIAGILVRIIGLIYRIPVTNILGTEGSAIYGAAFDVYSILLLLSSMSMPLAVSKLVSARVGVGEYRNAKRIFAGAMLFSAVTGLLVGIIAYFGANLFANLLGFPQTAFAIRVLAPTLVIMSVVGVLRGYFQGLGTMVPTALSQLLEQIANAIVSIVAAKLLFNAGAAIDEKNGSATAAYAYGAAGGTMGTLLGAATALAFLIFVYLIYKKSFNRRVMRDRHRHELDYREVIRLLVITIIPVLISTTIYNFSNMIDSGIFGNIMDYIGLDDKTKRIMWGAYTGQYKTLSNVPIAVAAAMSSSVVPSLIASVARKNRKEVRSQIDMAIQFTMLIAMPCGMGLTILGAPVLKMLFPSLEGQDIASNLMYFSMLTIGTFSFSTITNSILQGIDRMKVPIKNSAISLVIHLVLLPFVLIVLDWSIYGVIVCDCFFALLVCILNQKSIRKYTGYRLNIRKTMIQPLLAATIMGLAVFLCYEGLMAVFAHNTIVTLFSVLIGVIVYVITILKLKIITEENLRTIPKGTLLIKAAKKFHLL